MMTPGVMINPGHEDDSALKRCGAAALRPMKNSKHL
jgi:hypothetical protein